MNAPEGKEESVAETTIPNKTGHTAVAVDLAKNVFEVAISEIPGRVSGRKRLKRAEMMPFFAQLPRATVLLEACGSAHHWARSISELGHRVVLLPPHRTSKYRDGSKTDRSDTKAMLETFRNESIFPVPVKSIEQQSPAFVARSTSRTRRIKPAMSRADSMRKTGSIARRESCSVTSAI